jgi:hypothetical protein
MSHILGDVNNDFVFNKDDVIITMKNITEIKDYYNKNADVNKDNKVDINDVSIMSTIISDSDHYNNYTLNNIDVYLVHNGTSINIDSRENIYGFEFTYHGNAEIDKTNTMLDQKYFTVTSKNNKIIGISFLNHYIPAGKGTLLNFKRGISNSMSGIMFLGRDQNVLNVKTIHEKPKEEYKKTTSFSDLEKKSIPHMIVYESLNCGGCIYFYNKIYPKLKKDFIDKNLLTIEFRHYPINKSALDATKIAICEPSKEKEIVDIIFKNTTHWKGNNTHLKHILRDNNIFIDIDKCLIDISIQNKIDMIKKNAKEKYKITMLPTIIINNEKYEKRFSDYEEMKKHLSA